ncbi:MAG: hypothetical protein WBG70_11040, partial [Spirulinaceae cyanobacterium]
SKSPICQTPMVIFSNVGCVGAAKNYGNSTTILIQRLTHRLRFFTSRWCVTLAANDTLQTTDKKQQKPPLDLSPLPLPKPLTDCVLA